MRLSKPRVAPADAADWTPEQAEIMERFGNRPALNVFGTMLHHPDLFRRWLVFANHILGKSTISTRDREVLILRTAWRVQSEYEWGQHLVIARDEGFSEDDIAMARNGPDVAGPDARDLLLLRTTDELLDDAFVSDATWAGLTEHYDTQQIMDIAFTVGQYNMLAMGLNSFGVQRDAGVPGFDD